MMRLRTSKSWARALALAMGLGAASPAIAQPKPKPAAGAKKKPPAPAPAPAAGNIDVAKTRAELFGADLDAAAAAAQKLANTRQAGALDALLDALAMGLHPRVAVAALDAVAQHSNPASLDVLLYYARNRNPEVRARAILALGGLADKKALAAVHRAFTDGDKGVRAAACKVAELRHDRTAAEPMVALLKKGDEAAVTALAAVATPELARRLAELIGDAPDGLLAQTLGLILLRPDLGKEEVYVQLVEAIGKLPGEDALLALTAYISQTPEKPPRQSRRRAQEIYEQRLAGDQ